MAQRDYEDQPEAPDLGSAIQLETAESLVGPPGDTDALDAGYSPPDRPYALDDDELTVAGQREGETLDERLAREVPEDVPVDVDRAGRLADPEQFGLMERSDSIEGEANRFAARRDRRHRRRLVRRQHEHGAPHAQAVAEPQERRGDPDAVHVRAVAAMEIPDARSARRWLDDDVISRDAVVGRWQDEVRIRRAPDEVRRVVE